jgi:hypothetical protein
MLISVLTVNAHRHSTKQENDNCALGKYRTSDENLGGQFNIRDQAIKSDSELRLNCDIADGMFTEIQFNNPSKSANMSQGKDFLKYNEANFATNCCEWDDGFYKYYVCGECI